MRWQEYARYLVPGVPFYAEPTVNQDNTPYETLDALHGGDSGWTSHVNGPWAMHMPPGVALPEQGWKIHISATPATAQQIWEKSHEYCVAHQLPHKVRSSAGEAKQSTSKIAPRFSSGKFITIYPTDQNNLEQHLTALDDLLDAAAGPYILSDLRWRQGPVHVRYGAFQQMTKVTDDNETVHCIRDPHGNLVEDDRTPGFTTPDWVELPSYLKDQLAQLTDEATVNLPYDIVKCLHMSNRGGIYLATDRNTGQQCILKEARRHTGHDLDGKDAQDMLRSEYETLCSISHLKVAPQPYELVEAWESLFLAMEYIDGETLHDATYDLRNYCTPETGQLTPKHQQQMERVCCDIEDNLAALHDAGFVFGDLHPHNIMLDSTDRVVFIDVESCSADGTPDFGAPGYGAPDHVVGRDRDLWAAACIRLNSVYPLTATQLVDRRKLIDLCFQALELGPYQDLIQPALDTFQRLIQLDGATAITEASTAADIPAMTRGLVAAWRSTDDRSIPGDALRFSSAGARIGFDHGLAGAAHTMMTLGAPQAESMMATFGDVLRDHLEQAPDQLAVEDLPALATGVRWGIVPADQAAARTTKLAEDSSEMPWHLADGATSVAAFQLQLAARGVPDAAETAVSIMTEVAERASCSLADPDNPPLGLLHGVAGVAWVLYRAGVTTQSTALRQQAVDFLTRALDLCEDSDYGLQVPQPFKKLPYVADGTAGLVLTALSFAENDQEALRDKAQSCMAAVSTKFCIYAGLHNGRAGLALTEAALQRSGLGAQTPSNTDLHDSFSLLRLHQVPYGDGVLHVGDILLRLSADCATGTTGVVLAKHVAQHAAPQDFLDWVTPWGTLTEIEDSTTTNTHEGGDTP